MSNPGVELGGQAKPGQPETLGPVTTQNRPVYLTVVVFLGVILVIGVSGWLLLAFQGKSLPDGLGVILGTVAGGLIGLISDKGKP
jgi:hypothetical protein